MKVTLFHSHPGDNQSPLQALVGLQWFNYSNQISYLVTVVTTAQNRSFGQKISSSNMLLVSCSDGFLQVWLPSVRLTDVLSLCCR